MIRRPPRPTRTDTPLPYPSLSRSGRSAPDRLLEPACRPAAPTAALFLFPIFPQQRGEFRDVDVAGFVSIDAKHRPRAHDDLLDHRSHGPARGPLARA